MGENLETWEMVAWERLQLESFSSRSRESNEFLNKAVQQKKTGPVFCCHWRSCFAGDCADNDCLIVSSTIFITYRISAFRRY